MAGSNDFRAPFRGQAIPYDGPRATAVIDGRGDDVRSLAGGVPGEWADPAMGTCVNGHTYPLMAGGCPFDEEQTARTELRKGALDVHRTVSAPQPVIDFIASDIVTFKDNGKVPRTYSDYGYGRKIGFVNHIPVCRTLAQLDAYFTGGSAVGSTHFGVGRDQDWTFRIGNVLIPCASVSQYLPLYGVSPWAQGIITRESSCELGLAALVAGMRPGEPNGAFHSAENVAMSGADGVTDAQFNSNVFLRAYCSALDGYPIDPIHQLWHGEIDRVNRCADPGWTGELEDAMQDAARRLLLGDLNGLRGKSVDEVPVPPTPEPPPTFPPYMSPQQSLQLQTLFGEGVIYLPEAYVMTDVDYTLIPTLTGGTGVVPAGTRMRKGTLYIPDPAIDVTRID